MPRLIDADKTIGHIKTRLLETALNNATVVCDVSYIYQDCADNRIETWIDEMPTVDAVPLKDYKSMERTVNKLTKALADAELMYSERLVLRALQKHEDETEPVKHGRWKRSKFYENIIFCDECGEPFELSNSIEHWNYCPNCGVKMEEGEKRWLK